MSGGKAGFAKVKKWFASRGWKAFPFQEEVWRAYLNGKSGLIHAATGTGKTYAAWMGPLLEWTMGDGEVNPPLRVLWITPLRALVADTENALRTALIGLDIPWRLEQRTGDTKASIRARQKKKLPTALVTTPESLALLLAREDARELFRGLRLVIADEWHELMGSKRGVQTELALARLRRWNPGMRTWGLSATLGNLDTARATLLGKGWEQGRLVRGLVPKEVRIDSLIPEHMDNFPWAGHLGINMLPQVIGAIEEGQTTLVFTNTRSQTEIWFQAILAARPDWAAQIALHHASLERKTRDFVEDGLRAGTLRCVVCTSSLDLGVDFTPVDRVIQIGSPKGVARLLQRAGRSGHRPGVLSRVTCAPTHAWELVEVAAARDAVTAGAIESRYPVERPLDLLAQWLVTVAVSGGFVDREMFDEVRETYAFRDLSHAEWDWVLGFVTHGGEALRAYPEYARVTLQDGKFVISNRTAARRHLLSTGTIVSDAAMDVRYMTGGRLGSVEEGFIARLRPGDRFAFSGKVLEFVRVRDMTAWVKKAAVTAGGIIPSWEGGRMPLSNELAAALRKRFEQARNGVFAGPEMEALKSVFATQASISRVPGADEFLIERVVTREGHHLFFYPFAGRLVHEGLAALMAWRISRIEPISFSISCNDYGFELLAPSRAPIEEALAAGLLAPTGLAEDIPASLNAAEMARRQFREIARVAGLTFNGYPGQNKSVRQLQVSSGLLFDVFMRYDSGNLLLDQAHREVLERQLERSRLGQTLDRLSQATVVIQEMQRPSPLCFPLMVDRTRNRVSSEKLGDRIRRMAAQVEPAHA
ncbi:MAG: ligase-associated DNA damage response DEXH box helicase [Acidobacteriota bacterium]|nr:ligase-associated DNA damage response DEXH box helicase [Acidobacteriota bacterium]